MVTKRQLDLLLFVHKYIMDNTIAPSFEEMREGMGLKSKSGIHKHLTALEERGFILRLPGRCRAIEIIRLPGMQVSQGQPQKA